MIDIVRIVEEQASLSSYRATQDEEHAVQLELLIELTKPKNIYVDWHPLIATPFRYSPPHPHARFRPPYGKNIFYGSLQEETALYEHAFHFMRERMHLDRHSDAGLRTLFYVEANDQGARHIRNDERHLSIVARDDYSASQQWVMENQAINFIYYPSCRDPRQRDNAAILDIERLAKQPKWASSRKFFYDNRENQITWLDYPVRIRWEEVAC